MSKKLLRPPQQGSSLTDKDGKPTSHQYRWMDGVTEVVSDLDGSVSTLNTNVSTLQTNVSNLTTTVTTLNTQKPTSGTVILTTSGTSHTFTGIPSWVRRVTLMLWGVQRNSSATLAIQVGTLADGIRGTAYYGANTLLGGLGVVTVYFNNTGTFPITLDSTRSDAGSTFFGQAIITCLDFTNRIYTLQSSISSPTNGQYVTSGGVDLGTNVLDRVRLTSSGATFSAGRINILYE